MIQMMYRLPSGQSATEMMFVKFHSKDGDIIMELQYPFRLHIEKKDGQRYGFRWSANSIGDVFIIRLIILGEEYEDLSKHKNLDYYTKECFVDEIQRLRDGMSFPCINYGAYYLYNFKKGDIIHDPIYYCKSIVDLNKSQGTQIKKRLSVYKEINDLIESYDKKNENEFIKKRVKEIIKINSIHDIKKVQKWSNMIMRFHMTGYFDPRLIDLLAAKGNINLIHD